MASLSERLREGGTVWKLKRGRMRVVLCDMSKHVKSPLMQEVSLKIDGIGGDNNGGVFNQVLPDYRLAADTDTSPIKSTLPRRALSPVAQKMIQISKDFFLT